MRNIARIALSLMVFLAVGLTTACSGDSVTSPSISHEIELQPFAATEMNITACEGIYGNTMSAFVPEGSTIPDLVVTSSAGNTAITSFTLTFSVDGNMRKTLRLDVYLKGMGVGKSTVLVRHKSDPAAVRATRFEVQVYPDNGNQKG